MIYLKTGIGIELRGEDMLIASLQSNFSGGTFTHFKRITGYRLRAEGDVRNEINQFFRAYGLSKDSVVLGIPRKDVVLRYLDLPSEVKDDLKQVVQYQVQSFEPTEEDSYYYDYVLLDEQAGQKKLSVLLIMVRKTLLDGYLHLLQNYEISPIAVVSSSMGLANLFLQNPKDLTNKTYILADLSASGLELLALRQGSLVYSREASKEDGQKWSDLFLTEVNEAVSKIRLNPEGTLEKIILTGVSSESAYEDIKARIPECELLRKSLRLSVPGENKAYIQEAASALGLALTGMGRNVSIKANLLPPDIRRRQMRWAYIPAAVLGLIILLLIAGMGFRQMWQNRQLVSMLDQEIKALDAPVKRVKALRNQTNALETKIQFVENLVSAKDKNLEILQELTAILPADTFLTSYSNRDGTIQLIGLGGSPSGLIPKLEKSLLLRDVNQKGTSYRDAQTGKDRFTFEAKLEK
jgi:Tfp pilus assembly protein PilN